MDIPNFLAICVRRLSLLAGLLDDIQYSYRAVVDKFSLVVQNLFVRVKGSIWVRL